MKKILGRKFKWFGVLFCLLISACFVYGETCPTKGTVEYQYTASGCDTITKSRTCCASGNWSGWGEACTYCAGNASYDYGWFRGECFKQPPFSCSDVTLSDKTWGMGPGDNETGWGMSCGCPDGAQVTINQKMWTDNKMDVTMACYNHQLKPEKQTSGGGLGTVNATSASAALSICSKSGSSYVKSCNSMMEGNRGKKCTTSSYTCNKTNSGGNYYNDCYTSSSNKVTADVSGPNQYMCVCNVEVYKVPACN